MSEFKDPAIKLFGKTIQLSSNVDVSADPHGNDLLLVDFERCSDQKLSSSNVFDSAKSLYDKNDAAMDSKLEDGPSSTILVKSNEDPTKSSVGDSPKTPSQDKESSSLKSSQKEEQSETNSTQEKPLRKPDKILPCPRCNSMDTKFCYFNNYNLKQPRHFCKNCQRYWTAGGTMRNVPVGAGRRKNKNSSHHRHIVIPDVFQAHPDAANGMIYPVLRPNGSVLAFRPDAPLSNVMASAPNIAGKSPHCVTNGFLQPEQRVPISAGTSSTNGCINTSSKSTQVQVGVNRDAKLESPMNSFHGFTPQVPYFPAPPWPHPWNPAQWGAAVPPPHYLPPGFPVSIYATPPYWGCGVPGSCHMPWLQRPSASADHSSTSSSPNSPLGKHTRDGNVLKTKEQHGEESRKETKVLIPKTLRIDDPNEAAKSSIWATLGIRNEKADSINSGGLFRGFQSKGDEMSLAAETSLVLHANPAALSRSLTFHESAQ